MGFLKTLSIILQIISAIIVMILVLLQDSKDEGNIVTGASNNSSIGASRSTKLASLTKYFGIAFIVLTIISSTLMVMGE